MSILSLSAAISSVWRLKERVFIRKEEEGTLVFQFKELDAKRHALSGCLWYYNNTMLLMTDYDRISSLAEVPLHFMETWVAMTGLRVVMRNPKVLTRIRNLLGSFVRPDKAALHFKHSVQRIQIVHYIRRRVLDRREFWFTPEISVVLQFKYEKCHGLCKGCNLFFPWRRRL